MTVPEDFSELQAVASSNKKRIGWLQNEIDQDLSGFDAVIVAGNGPANLPNGPLKLAQIVSFFGLAYIEHPEIAELMGQDPLRSGEILDRAQAQCSENIRHALNSGFDGFVYVLVGAEPKYLSPMQYGGFILDQDRAILSEFSDLPNRFIYVIGGEETYMDAISDLSATALGWNENEVNFGIQNMRSLAQKPIFANHPDSDFELETFGKAILWESFTGNKEPIYP